MSMTLYFGILLILLLSVILFVQIKINLKGSMISRERRRFLDALDELDYFLVYKVARGTPAEHDAVMFALRFRSYNDLVIRRSDLCNAFFVWKREHVMLRDYEDIFDYYRKTRTVPTNYECKIIGKFLKNKAKALGTIPFYFKPNKSSGKKQ